MKDNIVNIEAARIIQQYSCNCGSNVFKIEKATFKPIEILCAYCGRLQHQEDIGLTEC